jgi:hypothetical protein
MKKSSMSSPQSIPMRCSDLETDIPPELAELPFLPNTDPLVLKRAVSKALSRQISRNQSQPAGTAPRPESVSH